MKTEQSILILDDEPDIGEYLMTLLEPVYSQVTYCSSPTEAKELVQKQAYSLILSDIMMPGLPGHEFVMYLRSLGRIEPVIFVTGNASKEVLLSAIRLGVADVIEKPFEEVALLKSIDRTFEIEKRKYALYESIINQTQSETKQNGQKKMIGLLHLANTKKLGESA